MFKKLKTIIFCVITTIITITLYNKIESNLLRWFAIFCYMFFSIMLTECFLEEEPGEFFNYFSISNWKKAKISSVLMIGTIIAGCAAIKSFIEFILIRWTKKLILNFIIKYQFFYVYNHILIKNCAQFFIYNITKIKH